MRLHKFTTVDGMEIRLDLDKVAGVENYTPTGPVIYGAVIYASGSSWAVRESFDDVIRLLDAAHTPEPDRYEEELAKNIDVLRKQGTLTGEGTRPSDPAQRKAQFPFSPSKWQQAHLPYRCPGCGAQEGWMHQPGCRLNPGRLAEEPEAPTACATAADRVKAFDAENSGASLEGERKIYWYPDAPPGYRWVKEGGEVFFEKIPDDAKESIDWNHVVDAIKTTEQPIGVARTAEDRKARLEELDWVISKTPHWALCGAGIAFEDLYARRRKIERGEA